jgi:molybdate transport system regulatory protein
LTSAPAHDTSRAFARDAPRDASSSDALNEDFREPLVTTAMGGSGGGGARLTPLGEQVLHAYREAEAAAEAAVRDRVTWLRGVLARQG